MPRALWVDPFKRQNYTSETNMFSLEVLTQFAEVEEHFGNASGAERARAAAAKLKTNINSKLWDVASNDHYITQLNADGSTADFLDIDSNLMAVAFGLADDTRAEKVMQRLKCLPCIRPGGYGTMPSGRYMGSEQTNGGMTVDSSVAMARVFYLDAIALRRVNDVSTFRRMLTVMQVDQRRNTWMAEWYNSEGQATHDPFYHEYPETLAMVIQRVKYGIKIGLRNIEVLPWVALFHEETGAEVQAPTSHAHTGSLCTSFRFRLSGMRIEYTYSCSHGGSSCTLSACIRLPRLSGSKHLRVGGFAPMQTVQVEVQGEGSENTADDWAEIDGNRR